MDSIRRSSPDPIKLGIILDSAQLPVWAHYVVGRLINCEAIEPVLVILNRNSEVTNRPNQSPILFRLWVAFDRWVRRNKADALKLRDWRLLLEESSVPVISLLWRNTDPSAGIDTTPIKSENCDLLLYLGSNIPRNELKSSARLGIWSVEQGSVHGQFWDMYEGNPTTRYGPSLIEQKDNQTRTLYRSSIATNFLSLALNENAACWEIADALVNVLSDTDSLRAVAQRYSDSSFGRPTSRSIGNVRVAGFLAKWATRVLSHEFGKRLFREHWAIILQPRGDSSKIDFERNVRILRSPKDRFYADPFLIERDGTSYLFFEDYRFSSRKGLISCCEIDAEGNCSKPLAVLERNYHLSYPFLFNWQGDIYMIPETRNNRTIEMYRAKDFPNEWFLEAVLMSDVAATDTTLLHYQGKWWLFTAGLLEHSSPHETLWLFYAESPMGPWTAHPKNPIVSDPRRARPAGCLFFDNGELIRPGQDCTKGYGYAANLHRVSVLSETDYQESLFASIPPDQIPGSSGIHTFNQNAEFRVIDCKFLISRFNFTFLSEVFRGLEDKSGVSFARDLIRNSR